MRTALLLLLLALPAAVWAADEPQIRVELEQRGPIYVGQSLRLNVTVLVPNYFLSAPQLPLFDLPGAMVTMPGGGAQNLNEQINGVTYAGIKRTYLIVPQQAGTLVLPPAEISFQYAAVPGQSTPGSVKLPPEKIDVLAPPGAKSKQGAVAVAPMVIKQQVEGLSKPMHVGDAMTRTIEIDADHTQSMMIPPPSLTAPAGVRIYRKDPQITDLTGDQGQFEGGRRVDVVTYRFEQPGSYTLPKVSVSWFDPSTQKTQQAEVPEIQVTVIAAPQPKAAIAPETPSEQAVLPPGEPTDWQRWILPAVALLGILVVGWFVRRLARRVLGFLTAKRQVHHESEGAYFERLLAACHSNNPTQSYALLGCWTRRAGRASIRDYLQAADDDALCKRVMELEYCLYSCAPLSAKWKGIPLATALKRTRQSFARQHVHRSARHHLSTLNPPRAG